MFVATLYNGKAIVEGKDVPHFEACPDGITSMQLLMPYFITKRVGTQTLKRNAVISIGRYDYYYAAKQAVANVASFGGNQGQMQGGQGQITHEILAGIDKAKNEVLYLELNLTTGDLIIDKFDYDMWIKKSGINEKLFKKGALKK